MTQINISALNDAVAAVAPIDGVSVGRAEDRSTWRIDFATGATAEQRASAQAVLAAFDPAAPTADDVRAEASRRLRGRFGARDGAHLEIIIANASREAIRLLRIKADRPWTTQEAVRAAELEAADALVEAIRAASNAMEAAPPADYRDDARWPV